MKVIATHSHFNGLEFVLVHRVPVWKQLMECIEKQAGSELVGMPPSTLLEASGWSQLGAEHAGTFLKDGVALRFCFDLRGPALEVEFDRLVASYRNFEFDVCILIFAGDNHKSRTGNTEKTLRVLRKRGRNGFVVPLILLGVAPPVSASGERKALSSGRPSRRTIENSRSEAMFL
jgi:hypothetical protein